MKRLSSFSSSRFARCVQSLFSILLLAGIATPLALNAQSPGTLDTTFTDPNFNSGVGNFAVDANGKIVAIGPFSTVGTSNTPYGRLARLNSNGALDTTFANTNLNGGGTSQCTVIALSSGKYLVAGNFSTVNGTAYSHLARTSATGTLDTTFANINTTGTGTIFGALLDGNGNIIIFGSFAGINGNTTYAKIARLTSEGVLDTTFTPPAADVSIQAATVSSTGKIYIAGGFTTLGSTARHGLARINSDGSLDTAFQDPNLVGSGVPATGRCVLEDANGKVVVGGVIATAGASNTARGSLARFNSDGTLDTTFADPNLDINVLRIVLDANRKIIASGAFTTAGPSSLAYKSLVRINTDGTVDTAFANPNLTDATGATAGLANGLALDSSGRILVSGNFVKAGSSGLTYNHMARFYNSAPVTAPTITTPTSASITVNSASLGGNVTSNGGGTLSEVGVVYSLTTTNANPQLNGTGVTKVLGTAATGVFTVPVTGLTNAKLYSFAAYATNGTGTTYTSVATFTTAVPPSQVFNANGTIFVRPGGATFTWTYGSGTTPQTGFPGTYPVTQISYHDVPPQNFFLTRGRFEFSTDSGLTWSTYAAGTNNNTNYTTVAGKIWRFVDTLPSNTTTFNNIGFGYALSGGPTGNVGTTAFISPDNPPTDMTPDRTTVFDTLPQGSILANVTPVDTGSTLGGWWVLESQSVPNLFGISFDRTANNQVALTKSTGTMPSLGTVVTVTLRYYDLYQTDNSGNPISGQGFSKQLSFTVTSEVSNDVTLGNDIAVNTFTTNNQSAAAVASLTTGNLAVVWQSASQGSKSPSANSGIYGQLLSNTGAAVGSEFVISNAGAAVDEIQPAVAALAGGRFVVAYSTKSGADYDIGFRIIEANGTVGSQIIANTTTTGEQFFPAVTTLTDGSFVVAWYSSSGDIRARQFAAANGSAVGSEVLFADGATAGGYFCGSASLSNGSYVVSWVDGNGHVIVKIAGGSAVDTGITSGYYASPHLAGLSGGGFVVTADAYNSITSVTQIEAVYYNNSGVVQVSKFVVNTLSGGNRYGAAVAALSGGGFLIGWNADSHSDYDLNGVFGRRYDSAGVFVDATEFEINQHRAGDQAYVALAPLASNAFAAAWTYTTAASIAATTNLGDIYARVLLTAAPAPTVTNVTATTTDGSYKAGASITITVTFSASVTVTGTPTLALNSGGSATYSSGSGTSTLTFSYTVAATQNSADLDYSATTSLALASGTINASTGGTAATLTLPSPGAAGSLGFNKAIVIDTTAPTILSINRQTPSVQTTSSATVTFRVTYSENVVGVTTSSFAVIAANGSNIVGTVTGVSGTGNTRDVTVSITSGTGDFRLRGVN